MGDKTRNCRWFDRTCR